jgi:hypothetical protein
MADKRLSPSVRLTKRAVDEAAPSENRYEIWDSELKGFELRIEASGRKSFIIRYRADGGGRNAPKRLVTIGAYGTLTPDQARTEAKKLLGSVATGQDPGAERHAKRSDLTVSELCELYLREGCPTKKPSTLATDGGRIDRHIKPMIGTKRISTVTRGDIQWLMRQIADGKTKADLKTVPRGADADQSKYGDCRDDCQDIAPAGRRSFVLLRRDEKILKGRRYPRRTWRTSCCPGIRRIKITATQEPVAPPALRVPSRRDIDQPCMLAHPANIDIASVAQLDECWLKSLWIVEKYIIPLRQLRRRLFIRQRAPHERNDPLAQLQCALGLPVANR